MKTIVVKISLLISVAIILLPWKGVGSLLWGKAPARIGILPFQIYSGTKVDYLQAMKSLHLAPIPIFSPTTPIERMKYLSTFGRGFIYCIARKGVTGTNTTFSDELDIYLSQCRKATSLPMAVGFGVKEKADIDFLKGKVEIAVIGTQIIRMMEKNGSGSIGVFIHDLR